MDFECTTRPDMHPSVVRGWGVGPSSILIPTEHDISFLLQICIVVADAGAVANRNSGFQCCGSVTISVKTPWRDIQVRPADGTSFTVFGFDPEKPRLAKFDGVTGEKLRDVEARDVDRIKEVRQGTISF